MGYPIPEADQRVLNPDGTMHWRWRLYFTQEQDAGADIDPVNTSGAAANAHAAQAETIALQAIGAHASRAQPSNAPIVSDGSAAMARRDVAELAGRPESGIPVRQRQWSTFETIRDTKANRANFTASAYYGWLYIETDTNSEAVFQSIGSAWVFVCGISRGVLADIPTLTTDDENYLYEVTDYGHVLRWNGSAWLWGPGDLGSGFYQLFETTPTAQGWQICDGSTVARLNADGTTTNVTVPNVTTPAYLKGGITAAAVAAASGLTTSVSGGTPAGTVSAIAATATAPLTTLNAVGQDTADNAHTHPAPTFTGSALAGHDHGPNSLELRNKQAILYYRR